MNKPARFYRNWLRRPPWWLRLAIVLAIVWLVPSDQWEEVLGLTRFLLG